MSADENLFYVKTPDGDVHRVTLDQLDDAFNAGRIDEHVTVLAPGSTKWMKLGELAGLDEPAPAAATPIAFAPMPSSLRPVSMDLSDDPDLVPFKAKSRKGLVIGAMIGLLAIGGGVLASSRMHLGSSSSSTAAAAIAAPPPVTAAPPPPAPAPAPVATTPPVDTSASRINDDQKAKLLALDKQHENLAKAHKKTRGAAAARPSSGKIKSQGFTTGGNKFDPLNANL